MKNLSDRNIIILSSIDWDSHRQLHHELIDYLIGRKNNILFVENTGSRTVRIADFPRIKKRLSNFIKSSKGFKKINKRITSFSPLFFPYYFNFFFQTINSLMVLRPINKWLKKNRFSDPIIINFIPNPITYSIVNNINSNLVAYYMADNMTQNDRKFRNIEEKIISKSQLVFFSSINLKNKIKKISKRRFLPNGVNFEIFSKIKLSKKYDKKDSLKIVYLGAVRDIINENLILKISRKFPDDKIYFIGPILKKFNKLYKRKNIFFLGEIKHKLVPSFLKDFHIGILPYKVNLFTKSINPLKVYEYVSSGLPVISTNLPNIVRLSNDYPNINLFKAKSDENFLNNISNIKKNYKQNSRKDLNIFLKENAWRKRFKLLEKWSLIKEFENKYIEKKYYKLNKFKIFNFIFNISILVFVFLLVNNFFKLI